MNEFASQSDHPDQPIQVYSIVDLFEYLGRKKIVLIIYDPNVQRADLALARRMKASVTVVSGVAPTLLAAETA